MAPSKQEVEAIKKKRAADRRLMIDKLRFWVGVFSVPTILVMACMLIGAAYYLGESQLAVVVGLISTITMGLITSLVILYVALISNYSITNFQVISIAFIALGLEQFSPWGIDNLTVPIGVAYSWLWLIY